jgi:hypothetical protein
MPVRVPAAGCKWRSACWRKITKISSAGTSLFRGLMLQAITNPAYLSPQLCVREPLKNISKLPMSLLQEHLFPDSQRELRMRSYFLQHANKLPIQMAPFFSFPLPNAQLRAKAAEVLIIKNSHFFTTWSCN